MWSNKHWNALIQLTPRPRSRNFTSQTLLKLWKMISNPSVVIFKRFMRQSTEFFLIWFRKNLSHLHSKLEKILRNLLVKRPFMITTKTTKKDLSKKNRLLITVFQRSKKIRILVNSLKLHQGLMQGHLTVHNLSASNLLTSNLRTKISTRYQLSLRREPNLRKERRSPRKEEWTSQDQAITQGLLWTSSHPILTSIKLWEGLMN